MNEGNRQEASYLRTLSSEEAATFLIENCTDKYPVTLVHRSWKKADQLRLARQFLQGRAHASDKIYNDFLSFMSLDAFLNVVEEGLPSVPRDRLDLLLYYLVIALRRVVENEVQRATVEDFLDRLSALKK